MEINEKMICITCPKGCTLDVTREGLIAALQDIHEWDGNGIQAPADPGAKEPSGCFAQLRVEDGEFVRVYPDEGFECRPDDIADVPERFQS